MIRTIPFLNKTVPILLYDKFSFTKDAILDFNLPFCGKYSNGCKNFFFADFLVKNCHQSFSTPLFPVYELTLKKNQPAVTLELPGIEDTEDILIDLFTFVICVSFYLCFSFAT
jgi:HSP20 family molecular chaperone IbpA